MAVVQEARVHAARCPPRARPTTLVRAPLGPLNKFVRNSPHTQSLQPAVIEASSSGGDPGRTARQPFWVFLARRSLARIFG